MTDRNFEAGMNFVVIATLPDRQVEKVYQGPLEINEEESIAAQQGFLKVWRESVDRYLAPDMPKDHNVITHRAETLQTLQSSLPNYHGWEAAELLEIPQRTDSVDS